MLNCLFCFCYSILCCLYGPQFFLHCNYYFKSFMFYAFIIINIVSLVVCELGGLQITTDGLFGSLHVMKDGIIIKLKTSFLQFPMFLRN